MPRIPTHGTTPSFAVHRTRLWARRLAATLVITAATAMPTSLYAQCEDACHPAFTSWTFPEVIVGSPSGLARPFSVSLAINSGSYGANLVELWIGYSDQFSSYPPRPYDVANGDLRCRELRCSELDWTYLQGTLPIPNTRGSYTFNPRFGYMSYGTPADNQIVVQALTQCNSAPPLDSVGYFYNTVPVTVIARSTDLDGDGDTDQDDKVIIGRDLLHPTSRHATFNLNTDSASDNVVDINDYMVIVNEMQREQNTMMNTTMYECLSGQGGENPSSAFLPNHALDLSPPGPTTLSISAHTGYSFTFSWIAPGDDTDDSTHGFQQIGAAQEYDLRWSCAPITAANFASATRVTAGVPSPALAGTMQSAAITVDPAARYWAIRTLDHFGNWSTVGPCLQIFPAQTISDFSICSTSQNCMLVGWTAPEPWASQIYDLRYSQSPITDECSFGNATPTAGPTPQDGFISTYIYNLSRGQDYYAAVRSRTSSTEPWSAISNIGSTQTPTTGLSCRTDILCSGDGFAAKAPVDDSPAVLEFDVSPSANGSFASDMQYAVPTRFAGLPLRLDVFDVSGRRVAELVNRISDTGRFSARWDHSSSGGGRSHAGVYYALLRVGDERLKRMIVVTP